MKKDVSHVFFWSVFFGRKVQKSRWVQEGICPLLFVCAFFCSTWVGVEGIRMVNKAMLMDHFKANNTKTKKILANQVRLLRLVVLSIGNLSEPMIPMKKHTRMEVGWMTSLKRVTHVRWVWIRYGPNDSNSSRLNIRAPRAGRTIKNTRLLKQTASLPLKISPSRPPKGSWIFIPTNQFSAARC